MFDRCAPEPTPGTPGHEAPEGVIQALNQAQAEAVAHGDGPLLILAGAGTGKTRTLAARVGRLLAAGVVPERLMLLTFTRRAAAQMLTRAAADGAGDAVRRICGGTFHAVGNRLLRLHGSAIGLRPDFSVIDAADAADWLDLLRNDLGLATGERRFPRKDTLGAIYSRTVNAGEPLSRVLDRWYPWCRAAADPIAELFRAYTARKREQQVLDFDDLLLWWRVLLTVPEVGDRVAAGFDHILVDEYQDTNALQAQILQALRRSCRNLTVVGDDAQAIYGFRAATAENILRFSDHFPGTHVVRLERNYRSGQPVLDAANAVMAASTLRWDKTLWTERRDGARPQLHTCSDEADQSDRVCRAVLARREEGTALRDVAVLFRGAAHSDHLELELSRRGIPYVKYGGLRFLEAAHVKDLLALLRLLDNPADELAWFRVLQLLPGVGPATARRALGELRTDGGGSALRRLLDRPPALPDVAAEALTGFQAAVRDCQTPDLPVAGSVQRLADFYAPLCRRIHPDATARLADLRQLEAVASGFSSRGSFVAELVLDPPASTSDLAGPPLLDEDYLVLSTIHSAKGLEWDTVHVLHATDGNIPTDMACGTPEEIEEERRLLYVAVTRAREQLHVYAPLRYYHQRFRPRDAHSYAQLSRFLRGEPERVFDQVPPAAPAAVDAPVTSGAAAVGEILQGLWR